MEDTMPPMATVNGWKKSGLWMLLAVACFHAAYTSIKYPLAGFFIFGYAFGLVKLCEQRTVRRAFYFGLAMAYLCYAPQGYFFWNIFSVASIVLWLVLAFWVGLFTALVCACIKRWGRARAAWLIPVLWTGIEYFRSELYYLKFSWLNIGYALPMGDLFFGIYGFGLLVFGIVTFFFCWRTMKMTILEFLVILCVVFMAVALYLPTLAKSKWKTTPINITGIQLEFPSAGILPKVLTQALAKNTNAQIFVLSEYTLDGGVPDALKDWCRTNSRYLVVGGKDFVTNDVYFNTAFVVGTNSDIVFKQAKSVPIQFFHDGLPAPKPEVWHSPWGEIGICICYDLSYTRVTDELIRQGAQLIICPTMDVADWGRHQHELHARVAPVRAAEYGVPIFRLASSGISQAVTGGGFVVAQTKPFANGEILSAQLAMPWRGALPLDRTVAPLCTGVSGFVLVWLLACEWRQKRLAGQDKNLHR
jgi:apolipoprotein N-acyltransferase